MSRQGCDHFVRDIQHYIEYMRFEYVMTYAEVIGCLELLKSDVITEASHEKQ